LAFTKEQRPVNFTAVVATAGISTAWLYGNEALKQRIIHLCAQQIPAVQMNIPSSNHASTASKDVVIAALQKRVREPAAEIEKLKQQVEVAYGLVAVQANRKDERTQL
jgi:hypothetical protein